jgi:outer membrane protein TolC
LFFPSDDETEGVLEHIRRSANALGIEIVSADGRIPDGRYAFFKAYQNLPKDVDALYLGPLWGLTPDMMREFFAQCRRDRLPTLSAEGRFHVTRGATASYAGQTATVEGTVAAVKAVQILRGTSPSDLNTLMPVQTGWSINEQSAVACGLDIPEYLRAVAEIEPAPPCDTCELYTVSRALGQALAAHPGPSAAYAALDAAEHSVGEAISALLPGLEVTGAAGWVDDNTVNNRVPEPSNEQLRLGVHLDQTIFSLSTIRAIKTAKEAARQGELDAARARLDLEKAVLLAYVNVLHAEALLNAEITVRRFIDRFREHAEVRQLLGLDESDAGVRWKSARHEAVARVARARTNKAIAEMLLRSLLVIAPETSVSLDSQYFAARGMAADFAYAELHSTTAADDEVFAAGLADRALESNPSLESARAALAVKQGERSVNAAEWIPKIGFRASFELQNELADRPGLFEEKTPTWAVGALLSWRLFDGGARQKRGSALNAEALSLELRRDSTVLDVRNRVRQLASSYVHTLRNGAHLAEAVIGAEVYARRLAERVSDPLLVQLDAVEHYRATTLEVLINRFNHHRIAAELIGLMGWSMSERNSYPTVVLSDLLRSAKQ